MRAVAFVLSLAVASLASGLAVAKDVIPPDFKPDPNTVQRYGPA